MTDEDWDEYWMEGACDHLPFSGVGAGVLVTLAPGPLVLLGMSITNAGAAATITQLLDGSSAVVLVANLGAGGGNLFSLPDRGVLCETDLQILGGASGPVAGAAYVRYKYRPHGRREWRQRFGAMTSPSPQGPPSRPPSRLTPATPR